MSEGSASVSEESSIQEEDLLQRSRKKSKRKAEGELQDVDDMNVENADSDNAQSYKEKLLNPNGVAFKGVDPKVVEGYETWFKEGVQAKPLLDEEAKAKH